VRELVADDVQRVTRQMLTMFGGNSPSSSREDFVAAGLLGLVEASHEYDEARGGHVGGWMKLSRWRAIERARELLRWGIRTEADCSLDVMVSTHGHDTYQRDTIGALDQDPDETSAMCELVLEQVSGSVCRRIARLLWVEQLSVAEVAARLGMNAHTVSAHLYYARQQAHKTIALRWPGSSFHRACGVVAATYGPDAVAHRLEGRRDRQRRRTVRAAAARAGRAAAS
jgi:DNA-directed RNA polymerase specialized sigma24 family protein